MSSFIVICLHHVVSMLTYYYISPRMFGILKVLAHDDFSGAFNPTARDPPILRKLIAARELNIPLCNIVPVPFHKHEWEVNLATNFAIAFEFALEELLNSLFRGMCETFHLLISLDFVVKE